MITARDLAGAWHLRSWSIDTNNVVTHPFGADASGLLLYTDDGSMSAVIAGAQRTPHDGAPRTWGDGHKAVAFDSFFAYAGTFTVEADADDPSGGVVVHHVQQALNPALTGTEQRRHARLGGDLNSRGRTLTLTAREASARGVRVHALVWQRGPA